MPMMQAADLRDHDSSAAAGGIDLSFDRRVAL